MNRQNGLSTQDRKLLEKVEEIVARGGDEEIEADSLYGFCAHLASVVPHADDSFQQQLESRLIASLQQRETRAEERRPSSWFQRLLSDIGRLFQKLNPLTMKGGPSMKHRRILVAAALITVIAAAFVTYPPMRTWAQTILARIGRVVIITDEPTDMLTPPDATPVGQPTATPHVDSQPIMTTEEASAVVGFPVLSAGYIPAGYRLLGRSTHEAPASVCAGTSYIDESREPELLLHVNQSQYRPEVTWELGVGDAPTTDVTVRGRPGVWIKEAELGARNNPSTGGREVVLLNVLMWEEGDTLFSLTTDEFPLEEMLRIAESLE